MFDAFMNHILKYADRLLRLLSALLKIEFS